MSDISIKMLKARESKEEDLDRHRSRGIDTTDFGEDDWERVKDLVWHGMNRPAAISHVRRMKDVRAQKKGVTNGANDSNKKE